MTQRTYHTSTTTGQDHPDHLRDTDRQALPFLFDRGAQFVLTPPRSKRPIHRGWLTLRPTLDVVTAHRGGLGVVPWSLRTTAFDVDQVIGNGLAVLVECTTPLATLNSPRGHHCFFWDHIPRANARIAAFGCSGEVRGANGYLRLYRGGPAKLASALATMPDDVGLWPADLFAAAGVEVPLTAPLATTPILPGDIPPLPDPETVEIGLRHDTLFDIVRFWAYGQDRDPDQTLDEWISRVLAYATAFNARFPEPMLPREVWDLAYSISTWVWSGGGPADHSPQPQRRRGRKSGRVRRGLAPGRTVNKPEIAARDARIVQAVTVEGRSQRTVAAVEGVTQQTVSHIVRREAPLWTAPVQSLSETRPWEAEGISRATWYRRQASHNPKSG